MPINWFFSHPIQYFSPLLKELARREELSVYYYENPAAKNTVDKGFGIPVIWDTDLLDGYQSEFIHNYSGSKSLNNKFWDAFNPGIIKVLRKNKGSVVIVNGWRYGSDLMVILFSKIVGREVWIRAENPLNQEIRKSRTVLFLKKLFLRPLFRFGISKCLYIGTQNKDFYTYYGVKDAKLVYAPYAVDNKFFLGKAEELKGRKMELHRELGLPSGKKIILFSGKYIRKKNPMDLLKAFHQLNNKDYTLVMMGEGELRKEMEQFIESSKLQNVYLTGFVNQSKISDYYSVADLFVMCSGMGETWGLSVNEAMNFSKPVIVSDTSGCSTDLVKQGENGFVFPEGNIHILAEYIRKILDNEAFRLSAGERSREMIREFSIDKVVDNISSQLLVKRSA